MICFLVTTFEFCVCVPDMKMQGMRDGCVVAVLLLASVLGEYGKNERDPELRRRNVALMSF